MNEERKIELVDQMLTMLAKETEQKLPEGLNDKQKQELLNCLMLIRPAGYLDETFLKLQDELLSYQNHKTLEDVNKLKFSHNFCETKTEILNLNADIIVLFSSYLISSGHIDNSFDNKLILKGGLQIKEEISSLFQSRRNLILNEPFIVGAFNLPSKYVVKVVVGKLKDQQKFIYDVFENILNFVKEQKLKCVAIDLKNFLNLTQIDENILKKQLKMQIKSKKIKINLVFVN